jgi:hypothetical protein
MITMFIHPIHVNARKLMNAHVNMNGYECFEFADIGVDLVMSSEYGITVHE